jgi:hypothetical protein
MPSSPKHDHEIYLVRHLCEEALGKQIVALEPQDRPDVLVSFGAARVGIEVTVFHADEGENRRGSQLRMEEQTRAEKVRARGEGYQIFVPDMDPNLALAERVRAKCSNVGLRSPSANELWLLVSGGLVDDFGRLAATGVDPKRIQVDKLNELTNDVLAASEFDRAYFDVHSWGSLYEWTRNSKWKAVECASAPRMAVLRPQSAGPSVRAALLIGVALGFVLGVCVNAARHFAVNAVAIRFADFLEPGLWFACVGGLAGGIWARASRRARPSTPREGQ